MAKTVRQIVPMVSPDIAYFTGMVYDTDDAEADRLETAGIVEVIATPVRTVEIPGKGPVETATRKTPNRR